MSEQELLELRNFGQTSLKEVKKRLGEHGLALAGSAVYTAEDDDDDIDLDAESAAADGQPPKPEGIGDDEGTPSGGPILDVNP